MKIPLFYIVNLIDNQIIGNCNSLIRNHLLVATIPTVQISGCFSKRYNYLPGMREEVSKDQANVITAITSTDSSLNLKK